MNSTENHRVTELEVLRYGFLFLHSVSAIVSTVGNSLVLVTIRRTPRLHSPSNVLLAGLALSDLGVGLVTQIALVIKNITGMSTANHYRTVYQVLNKIHSTSFSLFVYASLFTLTAISVDRYLALRLHLRYRELVTVKRGLMVLVTIWLVDFAFVVWFVFHKSSFFVTSRSLILVCTFVAVWCYLQIFKIIRRHQAQIRAELVGQHNTTATLSSITHKKKSVSNILYVVGFFVISYIPWLSVDIFFITIAETNPVKIVVKAIVFLNSCVNPLIYCWRMRDIREAVKETIMRIRS